ISCYFCNIFWRIHQFFRSSFESKPSILTVIYHIRSPGTMILEIIRQLQRRYDRMNPEDRQVLEMNLRLLPFIIFWIVTITFTVYTGYPEWVRDKSTSKSDSISSPDFDNIKGN
ncbi:hypothetical protein PMAYCL1PPCAC_10204, partial [Pristionchus mayeri]